MKNLFSLLIVIIALVVCFSCVYQFEELDKLVEASSSSGGSGTGSGPSLSITLTGLDATDDSGASNSDGVTNQISNLTFTGTYSGDATSIKIFSDQGGVSLGEIVPSGSVFSIDIDLTTDLTHSITAKAIVDADNSADSNAVTIITDTTPLSLLSTFSEYPETSDDIDEQNAGGTDLIVMPDASDVSDYTAESNASVTYTSGTKQATAADLAGNELTVYRVYEGAETGGLRDAIANIGDGQRLFILDGTYSLTAGALWLDDKGPEIIGESSSSTVIVQATDNPIISFGADSNRQADLISLCFQMDGSSDIIVDDGDTSYEGKISFRNIKRSGSNSSDLLVNFVTDDGNGRRSTYWDGNSYENIVNNTPAIPSGTWSVVDTGTEKDYEFTGASGTTYWP